MTSMFSQLMTTDRECQKCGFKSRVKLDQSKCPECKTVFSSYKKEMLVGNALLLITVIICMWSYWPSGSSKSKDAVETSNSSIKSDARYACQDAVRNQSKFPTKADFKMFSTGESINGNSVVASGRVELMNGLGIMIPHQYSCLIDGETMNILAVKVDPG